MLRSPKLLAWVMVEAMILNTVVALIAQAFEGANHSFHRHNPFAMPAIDMAEVFIRRQNIFEMDMENVREKRLDCHGYIIALCAIPTCINGCADMSICGIADLSKHFFGILFRVIFNTQAQILFFKGSNH